MYFPETLYLYAAGKGYNAVRQQIIVEGNKCHGKEQDCLDQQGTLSPVQAALPAIRPITQNIRYNDPYRKSRHRTKILKCPG